MNPNRGGAFCCKGFGVYYEEGYSIKCKWLADRAAISAVRALRRERECGRGIACED